MKSSKNSRNNIFRWLLVAFVATSLMGCAKEEVMEPSLAPPIYNHKLSPKKTITIKRKKPTITNPSPRPLSVDYPTEADYEAYKE